MPFRPALSHHRRPTEGADHYGPELPAACVNARARSPANGGSCWRDHGISMHSHRFTWAPKDKPYRTKYAAKNRLGRSLLSKARYSHEVLLFHGHLDNVARLYLGVFVRVEPDLACGAFTENRQLQLVGAALHQLGLDGGRIQKLLADSL